VLTLPHQFEFLADTWMKGIGRDQEQAAHMGRLLAFNEERTAELLAELATADDDEETIP